jgi:hypothetical protein
MSSLTARVFMLIKHDIPPPLHALMESCISFNESAVSLLSDMETMMPKQTLSLTSIPGVVHHMYVYVLAGR